MPNPQVDSAGEAAHAPVGVVWGWLLIAGLAGACTLVVELAAVRLLAPWFGASSGVWTNVIGVILLALALGYLAGARLAARPAPERSFGWVLVLAGGAAAWTPALAAPVCSSFLPEGLSLHQAAGLWMWGSLASSLILFLPSAALLGAVGPLAVEILAVRRASHAGTAGGQVLCASTLGSLVGTFATTHFLVPRLGLTASFLLSGLLLSSLGACALWFTRRSKTGGSVAPLSVLLLVTLVAASDLGRLRRPAPPEGMDSLAELETSYQFLRVVDDRTWETPLRLLQVNEGLDSFQSVWAPEPGLLGAGFYYDSFVLPAWLSRASGTWKTLVLGLGAGTTFRVFEGALPPGLEPEMWGVEIDAGAIELGRSYFDLAEDSHRIIVGRDARWALRDAPADFDCIVLDAYANQIEIPAHLCSLEFFGEAREHLTDGGWLAVNAGGFGSDDPVLTALGQTIARAFGSCLALRVPRARNWVLFARRAQPLPRPTDAGACSGPDWEVDGEVPWALLDPLSLPGSAVLFEADLQAPVLTDDLNPMEALQRRSLAEGRERLRAGA